MALLAACSTVTLPNEPALERLEARRLVVLVPGITGVSLVDSATGKVVWGRGGNLLAPRDGGYRLALPVKAEGQEAAPPSIGPAQAIEEIRLGPIRKPIYAPIVRLMKRHGWQRGDLESPSPGDDFFLFSYDWRQDNSHSARRLGERLEALARQRGGSDLPVSLICQSNGAHICRYLVKYGKVSLEAAESGAAESPEGIRIEQLILVGNANGGSLRILNFLNEGRKYVSVIGRKFHPETFFTFPSLFQDLPTYRADLFLDERGQPLDIDLFDPATWQRYGWSIYATHTSARLSTARAREVFGDAAARELLLHRNLSLARRFQSVLQRDMPLGETRYYLIQNWTIPTPDRAILTEKAGVWQTLVSGDPMLLRLGLEQSTSAPGDGHATAASQRWLSPGELEAFGAESFPVDGRHFEMILEYPALERLLEILGESPLAAIDP